jgi:hypothetical protein
MTALTRGPLSPRVYWTRRIMVIGTALLLVFGLARLLIGGSDASSAPEDKALQSAATPRDYSPPPGVTKGHKQGKGHKKNTEPVEPVLAAPSGPCADEDIAVTPEVTNAEAGRDVRIVVGLRTIFTEACTWQVSPETLTMKITSGKDDIWSSRQCPHAIPRQDVVVRQDVTEKVVITWSSKRSDDECSRQTGWAYPGWYHVAVSALAGEPSDLQFQLEKPKPEVVTETVRPHAHKNGKNDKNDQNEPKHR